MSDNRKYHDAVHVAKQLIGMQLAYAFTYTRSFGLNIRVRKLDGVPHTGGVPAGEHDVFVDVAEGVVKHSSLSEEQDRGHGVNSKKGNKKHVSNN